jgi:Protein of unknown function DUF2625
VTTNPNPDDLTATQRPAWPQLEAELLANPEITILPIASTAGRGSLYRLQVTTQSRMGALVLHTGGLLADDGWLRVLGGGDERGLPSWRKPTTCPAMNSHPRHYWSATTYPVAASRSMAPTRLPPTGQATPGEVCNFGPDTMT